MSQSFAPTTLFVARFSLTQLLPPTARRYIVDNKSHPITPKIKHMYDIRDPKTLWWRVSPGGMFDYKKVVRAWCCRRARATFVQELRARGYDAEGKRLPSNISTSDTATESSKNLTGSLAILLSPVSLGGDGLAWRKEMAAVVDAVINAQASPKGELPKKASRPSRVPTQGDTRKWKSNTGKLRDNGGPPKARNWRV